jgi:hypothetical protein
MALSLCSGLAVGRAAGAAGLEAQGAVATGVAEAVEWAEVREVMVAEPEEAVEV